MDPLIIILLVLVFMVGVILFWQGRKIDRLAKGADQDKTQEVLKEWIHSTKDEISKTRIEVREGLDKSSQRMFETTEAINKRLDNAAKVVGAVSKELGSMSEIGRQLSDFQEFLRSPKLRGNLGEQILRDLLEQILPKENWQMQYSFRSGEKVDAIIKTKKRLYPVDAKFPLENYQKMMKAKEEKEKQSFAKVFINDVRKHIRSVSEKYIRPEEKTVDFAIMYIPAEGMYYEVISKYNDELVQYANERKVMLVSPNSFYYFLRTVMLGIEGQKLEENSRQVLDMLKTLQKDTGQFGDGLRVLHRHVGNAKTASDDVATKYQMLKGKMDQVNLLGSETKSGAGRITKESQETLDIPK